MNSRGSGWWLLFGIAFVGVISMALINSAIRNSQYRQTGYASLYDDYNDYYREEQLEDYYQQLSEEETQKQYEKEQYAAMAREQETEAYKEELRHQQEEDSRQQMEDEQRRENDQELYDEMLREQQRQYEEDLMRQQEEDYYRQQQEQQYQDNLSCSAGWKCKDSNTKGYQYSNCSWTSLSNCEYGCNGTNCNSAPCSPNYLNEKKCSNGWVQQKYQYENCIIDWIDVEQCSYGCGNGACEQGCQAGYLNEYQCSGDWIEKKYQNSDCSFDWVLYEACPNGCSSGECNSEPESLTVSRVIDGDTVELSNGERVRLIGINAPESTENCYEESKEELQHLVLGKPVELEKDVSERDIYNRLLRYIYVYDVFVNEEMIRNGFAHVYEYPPDTMYSNQFQAAQNEAQQNERGCFWQQSNEQYIEDQCIQITNFHFDAAGNDNYNLNDEYMTFTNNCSYSIDMANWTVKDEATHIYTIPQFTFQGSATFTLYTGTGTNTNTNLYWQRTSGEYQAIWNNTGDTLFLRDSNGNLVLTQSYS